MMDCTKQATVDDGFFKAAGKVVFITGGAGGFGQAFAKSFLEKGAKVCLADINTEIGNKTVEELGEEFGANRVKFYACDVTKDDSFKEAYASCQDSLGPIDVLINNAGIGNEQNWKLTMDVNVGGTIRGTEMAIEQMRTDKGHKGGHVINVGSISGLKVLPFGPFYSSSKSAIIQYTRTAGHAFHMGYHGVSIKCLCPSLVDTPLVRSGGGSSYSPQSAGAIKKLFGSFPLMETEEILPALWQLLDDNKPGSVLVVEKGKAPWYSEAPIS